MGLLLTGSYHQLFVACRHHLYASFFRSCFWQSEQSIIDFEEPRLIFISKVAL